jgi:hypothetical protein
MAFVPRGGNQTGGRGRGRGGGPAPRGGNRGGANAPPLAAQLRQLDRLQEPEEMAVLRRYKDIGASQVRSSYGVGGLLDRQVQIPDVATGNLVWVSVAQADNTLQQKKLQQERERALARQEARLPADRRRRSWSQLAPEDRRVLLLSQKEWNSFRARTTAGAAAQQAPAAPQAPGQGQGLDPAQDGGDDASDRED